MKRHKIDPRFDNDECRKNWSNEVLAGVVERHKQRLVVFWAVDSRACRDGQNHVSTEKWGTKDCMVGWSPCKEE